MQTLRNMIISAVLLGLFAVIGTTLVAITYNKTADRIAANHRAMLLKGLHILIPPERHDNDLFTDVISVSDKELLGTPKPVRVYRARRNGRPVAVIINSVAPDGYSGRIDLLVAINFDGTLAGVHVVNHKETPGLGDAIDRSRSDWILSFNNRSLKNPGKKGWAVKRDGGIFDQFSGATVSPRAVVKAVYKTLLYYEKNRDKLFDTPSIPIEEEKNE